MASVVPPRPAELDIHKQGAAAPGAGGANRQPSGIGSAISNASNGVKVKREEADTTTIVVGYTLTCDLWR